MPTIGNTTTSRKRTTATVAKMTLSSFTALKLYPLDRKRANALKIG
jgi:hypothetical protein